MLLRVAFALGVLALGSGCIPTDERTTTGSSGAGNQLVIANWNVHNLINDKLDSGTAAETTDAKYEAHRKAVARVIDTMSPDVFVLQEVESQAVLDALNADLANKYPHTKLIDGNDPRAVDVAILSRVPFTKVASHRMDVFKKAGTSSPTYSYARDCLEVHLDNKIRKIVLLGVHFKSKDIDNPDKRLAEAQHTRKIADDIAAADPTAAILVLGDFNDYAGTPPIDAIVNGTPKFVDSAAEVPGGWSFLYQNKMELIDHQLGNPFFAAMLVPGSVRIDHGKQVEAASDHSPIVATYDVR
jgi:predicted extracellular nuclease